MFAPRRPRHPLLRAILALVGLGILVCLVVLGLFVGAAMLAAGMAWRLLRRLGRPTAAAPTVGKAAGAIDGEYRVLHKPALSSRLASAR